jgi:uncharacterized membrane protein YhiD involved in acid resistance
MAVGAGLYVTGIFATLLLLSSLVIIGNIEQRVGLHVRLLNFRITALPDSDTVGRVHQIVETVGIQTRKWHTYKTDDGLLVEFEAEITVPQERDLVTRLGALKARVEVRSAAAVTPL